MTNKILFSFITCLVFTHCNDGNKSSTENAEAGKETSSNCYQFVNDRDTIELHLIVKGSVVTGNLDYKIFEKDKNTGTIKGQLRNDTILAEYSFMSEGTQSAREVVFLKKGNNLVEGFGPIEDKNGKVIFKDRSALVFNTANLLTSVDCTAR